MFYLQLIATLCTKAGKKITGLEPGGRELEFWVAALFQPITNLRGWPLLDEAETVMLARALPGQLLVTVPTFH